MSDRVVWSATIKKSTFTPKIKQDGDCNTVLQIVLEGSTLPTKDIATLAELQNGDLLRITMEPVQLALPLTPEGEQCNAEIPNEDPRDRSGADPAPDDGAFTVDGL